jgi:hypothetical protein
MNERRLLTWMVILQSVAVVIQVGMWMYDRAHHLQDEKKGT